jgi:hypothetical protein
MEFAVNVSRDLSHIHDQMDKLKQSRHIIEKAIGYHELNAIYSTCIRSAYTANAAPDTTYIEFESNGMKYRIVFGFLKDRLPNEYLLIDQLSPFLDVGLMDVICRDVDSLESILMNNTLEMFSAMTPARRNNHSELRRLVASKKKKYTYYFPGKEYKKYIMGFIALTSQL